MSLSFDDVVAHFQEARQCGEGYTAKCPAHDDRHNSLSIGHGENGGVVIHCHAGCKPADVVAAARMTLADLAPPDQPLGDQRREVATYGYHDEQGNLLYQVVRYKPKDFRQRRPDGNGGWIWKLGDTPRVVYRLRDLLASDPSKTVFIAEGEKDCDRLAALGLIATTNAGGAEKWRPEYNNVFGGRNVVILPDNDGPGRKHAQQVAKSLHGIAANVRILDLPNLPPKGDVSDWLEGGGTADELVRLANTAPPWTPVQPSPGKGGRKLVVVNLADVQPRPVEWLWPGRVPLGKLTVIAGEPGLGKSFMTLDMAARVTTGAAWPDNPGGANQVGSVVLLSAEDDVADTIRPRLDAAGADVSRVSAIQGFEYDAGCDKPVVRDYFNLEYDLPPLEEAIIASPDCRLVIIDPIACYMGATDSHKDAAVRGLLGPLADLAARQNVAVVIVLHLNKAEGRSAIHRVTGSGAYVAAARSAWIIAADKSDRKRRLFLQIKNNLANRSGLGFRMADSAVVLSDGSMVAKLDWEPNEVTITADDALNADPQQKGPTPRDEAGDFLLTELKDVAMMQRSVAAAAKDDGISPSALRRAREDLGVVTRKLWFGEGSRTFWMLPEIPASFDEALSV